MYRTRPISGELAKLKDVILKYALDYQLDFYDVVFEVCDYETINILAAHGGFPSRYPHWRFGMEYDQLSKGYTYGVQKIYEMVVNTNPCYAYLLNANHWVDQKTVMAHVYGHADFFKNNLWFSHTNRKMMDVMANHGTRVRRYMDRYGQEKVERFIDQVLSIENLMDINMLFEQRKNKRDSEDGEEEGKSDFEEVSSALKTFMRSNLSKKEKTKQKKKKDKRKDRRKDKVECTPRDVMKYLMEYAPLEEWQSDILGILREEAYYFLPQRLSKIMNEGWASYWHSKIMTEKALSASEVMDFADHHAGIMAMSPQQINPYKIGIELWRDIEYRWDRGMFGKDYRECSEMGEKADWDKKMGLGRKKMFEIRRTHNDITFIDEFFTQDFCERQQLFTYNFNNRTGRFEIDSREFEKIKEKLLMELTNFGQPIIEVVSGNFNNRGELHLRHVHQGVELDVSHAADTMKNIQAIWQRPVKLSTLVRNQDKDVAVMYSYDGKEFTTDGLDEKSPPSVPKVKLKSK